MTCTTIPDHIASKWRSNVNTVYGILYYQSHLLSSNPTSPGATPHLTRRITFHPSLIFIFMAKWYGCDIETIFPTIWYPFSPITLFVPKQNKYPNIILFLLGLPTTLIRFVCCFCCCCCYLHRFYHTNVGHISTISSMGINSSSMRKINNSFFSLPLFPIYWWHTYLVKRLAEGELFLKWLSRIDPPLPALPTSTAFILP